MAGDVRELGGGRIVRAMRSDDGAGSAIALGIIAALVALTLAIAAVGAALAARTGVHGAADAAAIAAADALSGLEPGVPCDRAAAVAAANGARLAACVADGLVVTVRVEGEWSLAGIPLPLAAVATAGPPP